MSEPTAGLLKRRATEELNDDRQHVKPRLENRQYDTFLRPQGQPQRDAKKYTTADYTVGWICALPLEMTAARSMLDIEHPSLSTPANDPNTYVLGSIAGHNVVMACLPAGVYGPNTATFVAISMSNSFPNCVTMPLLVGIGGGVPSEKHDIRLGDIVVSTPTPDSPAIVQYDRGKITGPGLLVPRGTVNKPMFSLLCAVSALQGRQHFNNAKLLDHVAEALSRYELDAFRDPGADADILYATGDEHSEGESECQCQHVQRPRRSTRSPVIHYGTIGSGNQVIKHAITRDRIARQAGNVLCFEMEAAGVMDYVQCLVIRGICDYADEHKSKEFQGYAALTAASFAKELLTTIPPKAKESTTEVEVSKKVLERSDVTELLHFAASDSRRETVKSAYGQTCKWLLSKAEYIEWADPSRIEKHHGLLWIKGKPGTGKSTIMKFILEHFEEQLDDTQDTIVISFFFNARGDKLEKTTVGLYRALIDQLIEKVPSAFDMFKWIKQDDLQKGIKSVKYLQMLFRRIVVHLKSTKLLCIVDALDECSEDEVRDMVECFEDLGRLSSLCHFHIVFSSRHYPNITTDIGLTLILEEEEGHDEDIVHYVNEHLKIGSGKRVKDFKNKVIKKSNGIFLWVVLVTQILRRQYARGYLHKLDQILQEIPGDLYDLLSEILLGNTRSRSELIICMQWLAYACRPLRREELYHGLLSTSDATDAWLIEDVSQEVMNNYILDCSRGLAYLTRGKEPVVQFIHESVREILVTSNSSTQLGALLRNLDAGSSNMQLAHFCNRYLTEHRRSSSTIKEQGHGLANDRDPSFKNTLEIENRTQRLIEDAAMSLSASATQDGKPVQETEELPIPDHDSNEDSPHFSVFNNRGLVDLENDSEAESSDPEGKKIMPLFDYSVKFVLEHAERASRAGCSIDDFIGEFDELNWLESFLPSHLVDRKSFGEVLAENKWNDLVRALGRKNFHSNFDTHKLLYDLIRPGYHDACWALYQELGKLLSGGLNSTDPTEFNVFFQLLKDIPENIPTFAKTWQPGTPTQGSPRETNGQPDTPPPTVSYREQWHQEITSILQIMAPLPPILDLPYHRRVAINFAAMMKDIRAIDVLVRHGSLLTDEVFVCAAKLPVREAQTVLLGPKTLECLKYLMVRGLDVDAKDESGTTAIHQASAWAPVEVLNFLIKAGAKVNQQQASSGFTPLHSAVANDNTGAVRILARSGARCDIPDLNGVTALHMAFIIHREDLVRIMVTSISMSSNAVTSSEESRLNQASEHEPCRPATQVELVVKTPDPLVCGPVCYSLRENGSIDVLRMLYDAPLQNIRYCLHKSILQHAVEYYRDDMVNFLISRGVDINEQDHNGNTALHTAAKFPAMDGVVKVLMQYHPQLSLTDKSGNTALHLAGGYGRETMVKLLVGNGADLNAINNRGRTAFQEAAFGPSKVTTKLLFQLGAKADLPKRDDESDEEWRRGSRWIHTLQDQGACAL